MKHTGVILIITIVAACSKSYNGENNVCNCYREGFAEIGMDYDAQIKEIESHYVAEGVLSSVNGESYKEVIMAITNEAVPFQSPNCPESLKVDFFDHTTIFSRCSKVQLGDERVQRVFKGLSNLADKELLSATDMFEILSELEAEDFEHPFYKTIFFLLTYSVEYNEMGGIPLKLPESTQNIAINTDGRVENELVITVDSVDRVTFNGNLVAIDDVKDQVFTYYKANADGENANTNYPYYYKVDSVVCEQWINGEKEMNDKWDIRFNLVQQFESGYYFEIDQGAIITIQVTPQTTYGVYTELINSIKSAVNELRNEKCVELGWGDYLELENSDNQDREKLKMLRILVPERVIERSIQTE